MKRDEKDLENLTEALAHFLQQVGGRFIRAEQGSKGPMAFVLHDGKGGCVYLFFKRDWLHSYGHLFPQETWKGWGQTVNLKLLEKAARDSALIVIITPDRTIYWCAAQEWLDYAQAHHTIRRPSEELGDEASVPTQMIKRAQIQEAP